MAALDLDRQPTLVGPTLALRPLVADDFEALYAVANDPLLWAQHPNADRWQRPVFERFFADALASKGALIALRRADGAVIGSSRFVVDAEGDLEIGWTFIARSSWGGAVNGEMKRLMLDHAFGRVASVVFRIGRDNMRSRRAVEKLGAVFERDFERPGGGEGVLYRLDRGGYAATQGKGM